MLQVDRVHAGRVGGEGENTNTDRVGGGEYQYGQRGGGGGEDNTERGVTQQRSRHLTGQLDHVVYRHSTSLPSKTSLTCFQVFAKYPVSGGGRGGDEH